MTATGSARIVVDNFAYQPMALTVAPGQTVTVVNHDSTAHTLTATSNHAFDTGRIDAGATGSFTAPTTPGSYSYICTIHQFMHGTVTVR
ncbi:cupredoxin domain-containing protein [Streptacidiphilus neutrinimicus]|uniref:cupredoxin domain-containing protein n=1 Tax=Streptacidiphilus neutrinimicus TaxID=105420 RepID=UPI000AA34362|nr:cupredoxin domain-containing protein [Streptacidiphilus neutrinimicus]